MRNEVDFPAASKLIKVDMFRQVCLQLKDQCVLPATSDGSLVSEAEDDDPDILDEINPSRLVSPDSKLLLRDLERLKILKPICQETLMDAVEDESSLAESVRSTASGPVSKLALAETSEVFAGIQSKAKIEALKSKNRKYPVSHAKRPPVNYAPQFISPSSDLECIDHNDLILTVALWHPRKKVVMSEFQVYSSQTLDSLKDAFKCLSDSVQLSIESRSPRHRSGYFFIENIFYNDLRDANCLDYSEFVFY